MFDVGDHVVYPNHGAGVIESVDERDFEGASRKYFVLKLSQGDLKVLVPMDNTHEVGLRGVISAAEVDDVFEVLRQEQSAMPTNWNHRYKKNRDKLKSGDVYEVAEVVRNLAIRDREKGLSTGEKRMLNLARDILVSELVYAKDCHDTQVRQELEEIFCQAV
ncbi:MAG: CarD family transcriptional regulator [Candidatus Geothermincolia bacterium]